MKTKRLQNGNEKTKRTPILQNFSRFCRKKLPARQMEDRKFTKNFFSLEFPKNGSF